VPTPEERREQDHLSAKLVADEDGFFEGLPKADTKKYKVKKTTTVADVIKVDKACTNETDVQKLQKMV